MWLSGYCEQYLNYVQHRCLQIQPTQLHRKQTILAISSQLH